MALELDFDDFALPDEGLLEMKNRKGEPSGWVWRMAGPGHPATLAADDRITKRALKISKEQEQARVNGRKWKGEDDTPEAMRERSVDYIVARTLGWNDDMVIGGKPFPFSAENARLALTKPASSFFDQASEYLKDESSFTRRSAGS